MIKKFINRFKKSSPVVAQEPAKQTIDATLALNRLSQLNINTDKYNYPIKPPQIMPNVAPKGKQAPVLAMDNACYSTTDYAMGCGNSFSGFPGYPHLSYLATRAEYRAFTSTISTEMTRKWVKFSSSDESESSLEKIKKIESEINRLNIRNVIQKAVSDDCLFGRSHILIKTVDGENNLPLLANSNGFKKGNLIGFTNVEPMWTTPVAYNSTDPSSDDFYKPRKWWMLGNEVHSDRLITIITRPLPDILKPAYNFSGMSLSQLAEPYVDNWLRTRQSVSDLINIFSTTVFYTDMNQILTSGECNSNDITGFFDRAKFFVNMRSNQGLMMADKERESIEQINTPLSGLHELQAASQEHMCSVAKIPAVILTGISPSGLNASSEGEIKIFYDWINAQQESFWRNPLERMIKFIQLNLFGEIDENIQFSFVPLYQMTPKEESEILEAKSRVDAVYVQNGILATTEIRDRLAGDHASGYHGIDVDSEIFEPNDYDQQNETQEQNLENSAP